MPKVFPGQLHPFVLHFAVALLLSAAACDSVGLLLRREAILIAGRWNTLLGAGAAALAVLTGLFAEWGLGPTSPAGAALLPLHRALGLVLVGVWVPLAAWRGFAKGALPLRLRTIYLSCSYFGAALILGEAFVGSTLVYRHGVGLAQSARIEPLRKTIEVDRSAVGGKKE